MLDTAEGVAIEHFVALSSTCRSMGLLPKKTPCPTSVTRGCLRIDEAQSDRSTLGRLRDKSGQRIFTFNGNFQEKAGRSGDQSLETLSIGPPDHTRSTVMESTFPSNLGMCSVCH